jgi:hypothetical protein
VRPNGDSNAHAQKLTAKPSVATPSITHGRRSARVEIEDVVTPGSVIVGMVFMLGRADSAH